MRSVSTVFKSAILVFLSAVASFDAAAETPTISELLDQLSNPETENWRELEDKIWREWSRSGSPAMDLLLKRGRDAMEAEDAEAAIEHFTALIDHAPDFAEAWNARAEAYYKSQKMGPALEDLRHTLALNPQHFGALTGLAVILRELDQKALSLEAYKASEAIHPHRANVREAIEQLEKELGGSTL
ncbi:MAG: tetratricopeptide repeat protein [Mangrovicoccus sp.]